MERPRCAKNISARAPWVWLASASFSCGAMRKRAMISSWSDGRSLILISLSERREFLTIAREREQVKAVAARDDHCVPPGEVNLLQRRVHEVHKKVRFDEAVSPLSVKV